MKKGKSEINDAILKHAYYRDMPKRDREILFRNYDVYRENNDKNLERDEKAELLTLKWDSKNGFLPKHKIERLNQLLRGESK